MTKGITALKSLLEFAILATQKAIDIDTNKDRKISLSEIFTAFSSLAFKVPGLYDQLPEVRAEWRDLDAVEIAELREFFVERFDLPNNDRLEEIIKKTVSMLVYNMNYIQFMRSAFAVNP